MTRSIAMTTPRWSALLAWESVLLFIICNADMASTLYWVHANQAVEGNPWMSLWLRHGDMSFCMMKQLSFMPLLMVCAYYRPQRPRLIAWALRLTIVLYLALYLAMVLPQMM